MGVAVSSFAFTLGSGWDALDERFVRGRRKSATRLQAEALRMARKASAQRQYDVLKAKR